MARRMGVYLWSGSDNYLIYSTVNPDDYYVVPGVIKNEVNKAGSFEFDIYDYTSFGHGITERVSYVSVEDLNYERSNESRYLFYGRIATISVNLNGQWHVTCEGLLSNLMDYPLYMPTNDAGGKDSKYGIWRLYTNTTDYLFRYAINAYKEISGQNNIDIGTIDAMNVMDNFDSDEDKWFNYEYPWSQTIGDFVMSELLNSYGGIIKIRYQYSSSLRQIKGYIDWLADPVSSPGLFPLQLQTIKYGKNVLDASMENQNDEPIVGVFPTWTQKEKIGDSDNKEEIHYYLQTYNSSTGHYMPGIIYANPSYYNGIVKHIEFETGHSESAVRKMSQRYLNAYHTPYRYSINARVLDGYYMGEEVWRIELMQKYRVIIPFPGRNVDAELLCLSYELDITNPSNCTYLFGTYIPQDILKTRYLTGR